MVCDEWSVEEEAEPLEREQKQHVEQEVQRVLG
jgi:hypothetical protein